ncbi:MAG: H-type lectin domain-containing protein [Magnetococcus sp. YQC-9]
MIRLFWLSLSLVVILSGLLFLRGGMPEGEAQPGGWRAWLLGSDALRVQQRELQEARDAQQREGVEENRTRLAAIETQLHRVLERLERLESLPKSVDVRLEQGGVIARQEDKAWRIVNLFNREREFRERVVFEKPFSRSPRVTLGVVGMEPGLEKIHFQLTTESVDAQGFTLVVMTRAEERPRELRVSWMAFGE